MNSSISKTPEEQHGADFNIHASHQFIPPKKIVIVAGIPRQGKSTLLYNMSLPCLTDTTAVITRRHGSITRRHGSVCSLTDEAYMPSYNIINSVQSQSASAQAQPVKHILLTKFAGESTPAKVSSTESREQPSAMPDQGLAQKLFSKMIFIKEYLYPKNVSSSSVLTAVSEITTFFNEFHKQSELWKDVKHSLIAYLIKEDNGGQPELMDMLSALTIDSGLYMLFFSNECDIKSKIQVNYEISSGRTAKREKSTDILKDVLLSSFSSICSLFNSIDIQDILEFFKTVAYIIGSKRQNVSEEYVFSFDQQLQQTICNSDFCDKRIVQFFSEIEFLVSIDNIERGKNEVCEIRKVLEKSLEKHCNKLRISAEWLLFSSYNRIKGVRIASMKTCLELLRAFKTTPYETEIALWFLRHHADMMMYFTNVSGLEDLVIIDIQVLYDCITHVILKVVSFDNVGKATAEKFRLLGQISIKDIEGTTADILGDLTLPIKIVTLQEYLHQLTDIVNTASSTKYSKGKDNICIMPCNKAGQDTIELIEAGVKRNFNLLCTELRQEIEDTLEKVNYQMNFLLGLDYLTHLKDHVCIGDRKCFAPQAMLCLQNLNDKKPNDMLSCHIVWFGKQFENTSATSLPSPITDIVHNEMKLPGSCRKEKNVISTVIIQKQLPELCKKKTDVKSTTVILQESSGTCKRNTNVICNADIHMYSTSTTTNRLSSHSKGKWSFDPFEFQPSRRKCGKYSFCILKNIFSNLLCFNLALFSLLISSASCLQAELVPNHAVYFAGRSAIFSCYVQNAINVQWYYNGTLQGSNGTVFSPIIEVGILNIQQISSWHNNTIIQCEAVSASSETIKSSGSLVLVQGITDPVSNLQIFFDHTSINLAWNAPFSLDVSYSSIDITYCVNISLYESTNVSHFQCGINTTSYSLEYFTHSINCTKFNITVVAKNSAGNSSLAILSKNEGIEKYQVDEMSFTDSSNGQTKLQLTLHQDLCSYYELQVSGERVKYESLSEKKIQLELKTYQHYYNLSVQLPNEETVNLIPFLKTYQILNSSINSITNNSVEFQTTFVKGSNASGILYVVIYTVEDRVSFVESLYFLVPKNSAENGVRKMIPPGNYLVLSYDIDINGLIQNTGLPSSTNKLQVYESQYSVTERDVINNKCKIDPTNLTVKITCNCMSTYYQTILQGYHGSIESVKNITSMRAVCNESVSASLQNTGNYRVTVFQDFDNRDDLFSEVYYSQNFTINTNSDPSKMNTTSESIDASTNSTSISTCATDIRKYALSISMVVILLITTTAIAIALVCHIKLRHNIIYFSKYTWITNIQNCYNKEKTNIKQKEDPESMGTKC